MAKNLRTGLRQSIKASGKAGVTGGGIFSLAPLDLRFALQKTLDPRVTFTRASTGTYVGSDGVLRSAVTNLLLRSEEFNDATWSKVNTTVTANSIAAPNGTVTADTITDSNDGAATVHSTSTANQSLTSGLTYTISAYAKAGTQPGIAFIFPSSTFTSNLNARFNISTGTIASLDSGLTGSITAVGDGWYRCTATATATATASGSFQIRIATASTSFYQGNGTGTISLWGAQLEQASTAGDYIPTTSTINSAPRFDHNPTTGESLGLLVEEPRTNLLLRSEEFDNASWTKARSTVTANAIIAPDGASTADFIQQSAGQTNAGVVVVTAVVTTPALSIFAKAGTKSRISLLTDSSGNSETWFDLANGTVGTKGSNHAANIVNFGNGWYRCSVASTVTSAFASIYLADTNGSRVVTDSGGVYLWGAQLEAGAFPTSYIPTTSATVTRAADVASITGTNFSSWYNQTEGTVFIDTTSVGSNVGFTFAISDGSDSNRIAQFKDGSNVANRLVLAGVQNNAGTVSYSSPQTRVRSLVSALAGDTVMCANGILGGASTQSPLPTVDRITIGSGALGTNFLGGTIKRLTYWPVRLANTTLQSISQP